MSILLLETFSQNRQTCTRVRSLNFQCLKVIAAIRNLLTAPNHYSPLFLRVESKRKFVEFSTFFFEFKIGDKVLRFEVFKKFDDSISGVKLFLLVCVLQLALGEYVVKSNDRFQLFGMKFNLADSAHNVFF